MTTVPALEVRDLTLRFGQVSALDDVSFDVAAGELLAVIGPNGAGKSSLFNALSRVYQPDGGQMRISGNDLLRLSPRDLAARGVARSFQNLGLFPHLSVLENVLVGRHHLMHAGILGGGIYLGRARREERVHRAAAREALEFLGAAAHAEVPVHTLPYGIQKRVELARCLAMEPTVLLLDEPVAGMSRDERVEIAALIKRMHRERELTIVLVEHDMGIVMEVAERILVLDFGRVLAEGPPEEIKRDPRVVRAYLGEEVEAAA